MAVHQINVNGIYRGTLPNIGLSDESDFDIRDTSGYVLTQFKDGHIKTKNFDSSTVLQTLESIEQTMGSTIQIIDSSADLQFIDPSNNCVMRVGDGHIKTKFFDSATIVQTINSFADLEFIDSSANCVLRLNNGHIETKNFNSETLESTIDSKIEAAISQLQINKFYGKRLSIVGDSISTYSGTMPSGYASWYPNGDVRSIDKIWWYQVCQNLKMTYTNTSWSGSRVTGNPKGSSAAAGCSDQRITDVGRNGAPDIIICFIGCNDWGNNVAIGNWQTNEPIDQNISSEIKDFRYAYALMLYKIVKAYPAARVFALTNLDDVRRDTDQEWPSNNGNNVSTSEWNKNVVEVATALGARIIDLHACGLNYMNIVSYCVDAGLHPNAAGHKIMADFITAQLIANY